MILKTLKALILILLLPFGITYGQNTGYLKFEFNTDSAYVLPNNNLLDAVKLASGDSLELKKGIRLISLQTHFDKSKSLYLQVFSDSTVTYSYSFKDKSFSPVTIIDNIAAKNYYNANVFVLTDEDSKIFYNGEYQGTGFAKFNTFGNIGDLEIKNPDFGHTKRRLNVPEQKVRFVRNDLRPIETVSKVFSIFPGASQLYKRQHLKAALLGFSTVGLFTYAGVKSSNYHKELDVFYKYQEDYNEAITEQEALRLGDLTESQRHKVQRLDNQRKYSMIAGLMIYGYNIYDAFKSKPAGGYAKNDKSLEFYLSQEQVSGIINSAGTLRYNF